MAIERDHHGFDAPAPLGHPGRAGLPDDHGTGPAIGERLPDFELLDARPSAGGHRVRFHEDRGDAKAAVVFYRSAVWWPPCWTQLGELRDAHERFRAAGIRLYAISYDDPAAIAAFAEEHAIPYPLLSDPDSEVIRRYGILNDQVGPDDGPIYGIPYPGSYVVDEDGVVIAKFFHDSYKKRDSPEALIDAALGRIELSGEEPTVEGGEPEVRITAAVRGGSGSIRQGIVRQLVVRFELDDGLHLYGEPVPEGMIATTVEVSGPPGLAVSPPVLPPTEPLHLEGLGATLHVWSGRFDIVIPFFATGELASETRPLDASEAKLELAIRYQACDDTTCLLPKTERLTLELPLDVIDVPRLGMHTGHGQREGSYDAAPHMLRLVLRKFRRHPLGLFRFLRKQVALEREARARARAALDD